MNYELNNLENNNKQSAWQAVRSLSPLIESEKGTLIIAIVATFANVAIMLTAPLIIAHVLDTYILKMQFFGCFLPTH